MRPDVHGDERGRFIETYRRSWFPDGGREMVQGNRADRQRGALVGLHYHLHQADYWYVPFGEARMVLHDLREGSPTDGATLSLDLTGENHLGVFIPPGVAHGFAALTDMTITYLVDGYYNAADELGVAWDDPTIGGRLGDHRPRAVRSRPGQPSSRRSARGPAPVVAHEDVMMRLFVTGGAGFIGSNYVRHVLASTDDAVTVFDALTYAGNAREPGRRRRRRPVHVRRGRHLRPRGRRLRRWRATTRWSTSRPRATSTARSSTLTPSCRPTATAPTCVCDVARRVGVERFLHISTDEVYGSIDEGSFTEASPLSPRSPYSASKAGSDLIALSYHTTYGLPVVVTRSSNNFGPFQFPEKVIPLFVTNLIDGEKVPLYGDGGNIRDWCFVEDNCTAVDAVLRHGAVGEIYNIGGGNEITNRELTHKLLSLTGRDESYIEPVTDRPGHDRRYSVTTGKIEALGWRPARGLDEALEATVAWYRDNRWWWQPLKERAAFDRLPG